MRALDRKLLRDLRHHWSQVLSIAVVVGCGVMGALSMRSTLRSVETARDEYYARYRFADVFASVERAPEALARRVRDIPGVGVVQTRVVQPVTLDVPGLDQPAVGKLVSVPDHREPMPNDLHISEGRYAAAGRADEVMVSRGFATANHLAVGDTLGAVVNGRWQRLRVVGVASSPEYVYEIGEGGFIVDNRLFGVLWMGRDAVAAAAGMQGAFNDVTLLLTPRASEVEVIARLDALLARYGSAGAIGRKDQLSHAVLVDELRQLTVMGSLFPLFFLITATFLLHVVLSRLIATQREEIAALKAFGYSHAAVGLHYLTFAAGAVAIGAVLGVAGGAWLGSVYTSLYRDVFRFPDLVHRTHWSTAAFSIALTGGSALTGALGAVWSAIRLPPAEALRPPAPARFRPLIAERLGLGHLVRPATRMLFRNLERRPFRTLASVLGVALAGATLLAGRAPYDAFDRLMDIQYRKTQREDFAVAFTRARPAAAREELMRVAGVTRAELFRVAPVRLRHAQHVRTVGITGMEREGVLRSLVDIDGQTHALPSDGLVLSAGLAAALDVKLGDTVRADLLELGERARPLVVVGVLTEVLGANAYMDRRALNRVLREGDMVSGAYLSVERGSEARVTVQLRAFPALAGTTSRQATIDYIDLTMARSIAVTTLIVVFAAVAIALAVIYNGARVALSERGRDLASLRVLGFSAPEVGRMLLGEQAAITAAGIPAGFAVGFGFAYLLIKSFEGERHRFPFAIDNGSYLFSAGVVLAAAAIAALIVWRRVNRLDLIAVLKTRE